MVLQSEIFVCRRFLKHITGKGIGISLFARVSDPIRRDVAWPSASHCIQQCYAAEENRRGFLGRFADSKYSVERDTAGVVSGALDVGVVAVPAVPLFIAEVIEVLNTSFFGSGTPLDICVVVLALVV